MKFVSINEKENIDSAVLKNDYSDASVFGRIRLGSSTLFVKKKFKVYYISFSEIYRAFRRIKGVPTGIRGSGEIRLEYLVLCNNKEELCEIDLPDESTSKAILAELSQKAPAIKIGKKD